MNCLVTRKNNLNLHLPYQGIIYSVVLMIQKFNLSILELALVLCAFDFATDWSYHLLEASIFTLNYVPPENHEEGLLFGWSYLKIVCSIYVYEYKSANKNIQR